MQRVHALVRKGRSYLNAGLGRMEPFVFQGKSAPIHPPLFITGLPRSGTTLVYQYIVHRLRVAYFSNGVDRFPQAPCLTTWGRTILSDWNPGDFRNTYGWVSGLAAPHEAGNVWARFFGYHEYLEPGDVSQPYIAAFRETIARAESIFSGLPFVNKNVKHLLRLQVIAEALPEAHFLIVHRSLENIALSLLRGRYENTGRADRFWSIRPSNYEELLHLEPPQQIVEQLCAVRAKMNADIQSIRDDRVTEVQYESFCDDPESLIDQISSRISGYQTQNHPAGPFVPSDNQPQTEEEDQLLRKINDLEISLRSSSNAHRT